MINNFTNGLTNYWPIAGSTRDVVGGMDMTIQLNGQLSPDRFDNPNSAVNFNVGYGTVPPGVYFDPTSGFTIMLWIKLLSTITSYTRIIDFGNDFRRDNIIYFFGDNNLPAIYSFNGMAYIRLDSTHSVPINQWTHVSTTYNMGVLKIYTNGIETGSLSGTSYNPNIMRTKNFVGRSNWYPTDQDVNATFDELKIFNRPLSSNEIMNEMNILQPYKILTAQYLNVYAPPASYSKGLTNYWPFASSTRDVVGGMDMTIQLNGQLSSDRFDNPNSAVNFNVGYGTVPPGVYFDPTSGFTIMLWIKMFSSGFYPAIIDFGNGANSDNIFFGFNVNSYNPYLFICEDSFCKPFYCSESLIPGKWIHLAVTFNSDTLNFYINSLTNCSQSGIKFRNIIRTKNYIGGNSYYPANPYLNGTIDELKIFNRPLGQSEILDEMNKIEPFIKNTF
jgi:hypothetical protein